MNYFELYGLPVRFRADAAQVRKKFYELSKQYHPDRFSLADEAERQEALQMAALNNAAYKTLQDGDATLHYILTQAQVLEEEEKYVLPADFLMEMLELNEAISDYEDNPTEQAKQQAESSWQEQLEGIATDMNRLSAAYDERPDRQVLFTLKDLYFRKKYLLRIRERIDTFAAR